MLTIQQHNQTDVWLADESQAARVNEELARFLENPGDPRYRKHLLHFYWGKKPAHIR
ncbi:MAG: hypothetical protein E6760_10705 [Eggerthella sp.]|nr:hypothetical protein [Eggerthella sp.]